MLELYLGAALLVALAAVFLLLPGWFMRSHLELDVKAANRAWFERRREELSRDPSVDEALLEDAKLRLLQDVDDSDAEAPVAAAGKMGPAPLLLLPLVLLVLVLYWQLGAAADVALAEQLAAFGDESSEQDYRDLMLAVEQRAAQRPDNLHYQSMLGRFYMNEGDYGRASALYENLAAQVPGDSTALAMAAQAAYLAADRVLDPNSQMLAEKALSIDPHQRTALGLLGMTAYENGQYQAAISYWRRLLVMEEPDSASAQMINSVIARAQAELGEAPATVAQAPAPASSVPVTGGPGVTLRIELAAGTAAPAPADTLFVFARNPLVDSRMPVAVQRLTAADLPLTLRLDDGKSMAGQKISELAQVNVVARISPSGQPGEQYASYQAELEQLAPDASDTVHRLVLTPMQ